jgi:signal transduction histidine kinase
MLKFWKPPMNAHTDITLIVAAARPADLDELERQFSEVQRQLVETNQRCAVQQELSDPCYITPTKVKTDATMAAATKNAEVLRATASALEKTRKDLLRAINEIKQVSNAAVATALDPLRRQIENDIRLAAGALYEGLQRRNEITIALNKNGGSGKTLPVSIPVLDQILTVLEKGG